MQTADESMSKEELKPCYVLLEYPTTSTFSDNQTDHPIESIESTPRKSVRNRNKPNKFGEYVEFNAPRRRSVRFFESEEEDSNDDAETVCTQKPTALFANDDVEGQDMFAFKSRHTKHDLQNKVKSAIINSPKLGTPMKTPRKSLLTRSEASPFSLAEGTPKHVKDLIKKRIIREVDSDSAESDFSASSSDFVPEESENESESENSADESNESATGEEEAKKPIKNVQIKRNKDLRRAKDSEYIVTPDNYFMMNSSKKIITSDHTLERLKNFSLEENQEENEEEELSDEHRARIQELNDSYEQHFNRWLYVLSENFNIVLYGVGSKRAVIHSFQQKMLKDFPCIVVNGFFPSLTMKSILEAIIVDLLECSQVPSNVGDVVSLIDSQLTQSGLELFLIVHNIDGPMLRNAKAQAMLAGISQIKNVHTIASIDHINAPLLWDHTKLGKFRWCWWDATSFLPYGCEAPPAPPAARGALRPAALRSVYRALTSNAQGIFRIIMQYQLEHHKEPHYQGLPFRELYAAAREAFLASSDAALRAQLTEVIDHRLVRARRGADGTETLVVPAAPALLAQFLEQEAA